MKKCSCGKPKIRPENTTLFQCEKLGGWYWDCVCGSTLYEPLPSIKTKKPEPLDECECECECGSYYYEKY